MTIIEKYLKDNVDVGEFTRELCSKLSYWDIMPKNIIEALTEQAQPTLTEDEKVILRNLNLEEFTHIGRHYLGDLFLRYVEGTILNEYNFEAFRHLFKFIKERRRIFNKRIIRR